MKPKGMKPEATAGGSKKSAPLTAGVPKKKDKAPGQATVAAPVQTEIVVPGVNDTEKTDLVAIQAENGCSFSVEQYTEHVETMEAQVPVEVLDLSNPSALSREDLEKAIIDMDKIVTIQGSKVVELKACLLQFAEIPMESGAHDNTIEYQLARTSRTKTITTGMIRKARKLCGFIAD